MDGSFHGLLFLNPGSVFRDLELICFRNSPLELTEPFRDTAATRVEVAYGCVWQVEYIEGTLKPQPRRWVEPASPPGSLWTTGSHNVVL